MIKLIPIVKKIETYYIVRYELRFLKHGFMLQTYKENNEIYISIFVHLYDKVYQKGVNFFPYKLY